MKQLHQKIEDRKHEIETKKRHLKHDYRSTKRKLTSKKGLSLTTIGGFVLGFLLLPKKFKLLKGAFKVYTMTATVRQILDLIPHVETSSRSRTHSKSKAQKRIEHEEE